MDGTRRWFESESERKIREHNEGQADGAEASDLEIIIHNNLSSMACSDEYNEGFKNGANNPPDDD